MGTIVLNLGYSNRLIWVLLKEVLIFIAVILAGFWFLIPDHNLCVLLVLFCFVLLIMSPAILLFVQYYRANRNCKMLVFTDRLQVLKNDQIIVDIPLDEIKEIWQINHVNEKTGGSKMMPSDYFHYLHFKFKSGKSFYLTTLMYKEDKEVLAFFPDIEKRWARPFFCQLKENLNVLTR